MTTAADRIPPSPLASPKNDSLRSKVHSNGNGTKISDAHLQLQSHLNNTHSNTHSRSNSNTNHVTHLLSQPRSPPHNNIAVGDSTTGTTKEVITYIFPDFHAVRYFQKEFVSLNEFHIVEETTESGFDIYLVEQWVNNRKIGSVVSTYTGNSASIVSVVKFTVIKKLARYYPTRFQEYLNELMINHAKVKVIDNVHKSEVLFVTNLTTLPSNLNLIAIQNGDLRRIEEVYVINSNLKKLHCGGRSLSLITDKLSVASEDKFRQMYKIYNVKIPVKFAILELINLIQTSLFYFDLLDARYCDGFLCSKTEEAIVNWWNLIGLPHFSVKPNPKNGILPSRTVAAIISFIISIKLRLHLVGGCDPPKDPFDFENFMISIGQFQKQYKIEKRRKLDLETLNKLFSLTNQMNGNNNLSNNSNNYNANSNNNTNNGFGDEYHSLNQTLELQLLPQSRAANPRYNNSSNKPVRSIRSNNSGSIRNGHTNGGGPNDPSTVDDSLNLHSSYPPSTFHNVGNNSSLSAYRKNKNYYSKEFKKLTNVVKSTVQDHIGAVNRSGDVENFNNGNVKAVGVNKVSDLSPIEVETLDLEVLVKNFLIGKKLYRLWIGTLQNAGDQRRDKESNQVQPQSTHLRNHNYHINSNNHNGSAPMENNKQTYRFQSLKDEITSNQSALSSGGSRLEFSRYSRGLNKMRLGLQGRKGQFLRQQLLENNMNNTNNSYSSANNSHSEAVKNSTNLVDTLLGVESDDSASKNDLGTQPIEPVEPSLAYDVADKDVVDCKEGTQINLVESFYFGLNRRNSYPSVSEVGELNLNTIEFGNRRQSSYTLDAETSKRNGRRKQEGNSADANNQVKLVRSNSFSAVEEFIDASQDQVTPLETVDKLSASYLKSIYKLSNFRAMREMTIDQGVREAVTDGRKKSSSSSYSSASLSCLADVDEVKIKKSYDQLNLELVKLSTINSKMQANKVKIVDEDLLGNLDYKIQDLNSIIDRLSYETRIIVKRINELEESSNALETNLSTQCTEKVDKIINTIIRLAKFNETFSNLQERKEILLKLTGTEDPEILNQDIVNAQVSYECNGIFQFFILCIYEIIYGIFQILKFDRSRMNLDRIRRAWAELDPNRTYIEKAYSLIGRKPSIAKKE